ncbi:unnamed protein product [Cylicostephanus goldi]|uniref:Uncharacterized protein n=1 Tax=Cylicostephanus goldi TaxID=71465 RepID=A0A3P6RQN1_CYLGO|nr:unnamed protein product [Cylicostephanus goldi]
MFPGAHCVTHRACGWQSTLDSLRRLGSSWLLLVSRPLAFLLSSLLRRSVPGCRPLMSCLQA